MNLGKKSLVLTFAFFIVLGKGKEYLHKVTVPRTEPLVAFMMSEGSTD